MQIQNIAGYKFIRLANLSELRLFFLELCQKQHLKGTILLSEEGINLSLAGEVADIALFKASLAAHVDFSDLTFRESYSDFIPFKRLKVKIKKEIITLRCKDTDPNLQRGAGLSPEEFKQWLDENREMIVLDTRNDYEINFGTFANAINLKIDDFSDFPSATENLPKDKPIVMFCTGGIRCEKASLHLLNKGFPNVFQLEGGILNYFAKVGGAHYQGDCFVFDERIALDPELKTAKKTQCRVCQQPISQNPVDTAYPLCINHSSEQGKNP